MKRMRIVQGLALVGALTAVTWFVVVPAIASSAGSKIPPPSASGVTPTDFVVNDAPNDCKSFYGSATAPTYSFRIKDGTSKTYTDSATGATFTLKLNPGNPDSTGKSWPAYANNTYFSFTSTGAAIVDVGVDGQNERDAARYNYSGLSGGAVTSDGYLHADATKTNSDGSTKTLDGLDDMSFCYNQFAPISGTAFIDANGSGTNDDTVDPAAGGLTVTLFNGSGTQLGTTTTASDGTYTFAKEIVGTAYKVCIAAPTADANGYLQTLPTSGAACSAPASFGYTIAKLGPSGQAKQDFGFEPLGSVAGTVYNDVNQNRANDDGSPLPGWTITLYGGAKPVSTTTASDGSYKLTLPFSTSTNYTLCETPTAPPQGHTWAQDVPLPSTTTICGPNQNGNGASGAPNELLKGLQFTPQTISDTITGKDFGNVAAVTCNPDGSVPSPNPGTYNVNLPPSTCSTSGTKANTGFVVDSGVQNGTPYVSVWTGDSQGAKVPLLEHINFPNALNPDGTLQYTHLVYTDAFPFTGALVTMPSCKVDPRDSSDLTQLATAYTDSNNSGAVLPDGATSCVIDLTPSGTVGSPGSLVADVYSDVDGLRSPG
jgi:hypothetical protein